jgi:cytochrome b561
MSAFRVMISFRMQTRKAHTVLAYLLFLAFIAHFGAVLFHTLILRDRLFSRMAPYRVPAR